MTQERFLKLLDNPDLLASISYEELKTLALVYPYAHNLRYLLVIKSHQDNHPDFGRNLAAAAAYSLDRSRLFQLVAPKKLAPVPVEAAETVLELKPIETVQQELQALAPLPRNTEAQVAATAQQAPLPEIALDLTRTFVPKAGEKVPAAEEIHVQDTPPFQPKPEKTIPHIEFRPSFAAWASQFNVPALADELPLAAGVEKFPAPKPEEKNVAQKSDDTIPSAEQAMTPQMLAEKSVSENKDILSETLARLYARQGYRDKAIAMYERLCLAFPEKSAYFAAEIEKLKK